MNLVRTKSAYGYVIEENLTIAKEHGVEMVKAHGSQYYAWQRK
jgi:hypothetical protein